jgi:hypothetical protein
MFGDIVGHVRCLWPEILGESPWSRFYLFGERPVSQYDLGEWNGGSWPISHHTVPKKRPREALATHLADCRQLQALQVMRRIRPLMKDANSRNAVVGDAEINHMPLGGVSLSLL